MAASAQDTVSDTFSKIQDKTTDLRDHAKELYGQTIGTLPEDTRKTIGLASAGVAIGLAVYLIGRSRGKAISPLEKAQELVPNSGFDFSPVLRFLKLWMLYRVRV